MIRYLKKRLNHQTHPDNTKVLTIFNMDNYHLTEDGIG